MNEIRCLKCRSNFHLGDPNHTNSRRGGRLAHDHLASRDKSTWQEVDNVFPPASPGLGSLVVELLPVQLVSDDQVAAAASLKIALLEALVRPDHLGISV